MSYIRIYEDGHQPIYHDGHTPIYANGHTPIYHAGHTPVYAGGGGTLIDNNAPTITLTGASSITQYVGSVYAEQGATAYDNEDGNISSSIVITGNVDTATEGTYLLTYSVQDGAGNAASATRQVIIIADTTAPVLALIGPATITVPFNGTYVEQGATAFDDVDGDISSNIQIVGTIDTSVEGSVNVSYTVVDAAGNTTTITREVIVLPPPDTTAPVITLNGDAIVSADFGSVYTDAGATATDNIDGDISGSIVITGNVDTSVAGTYVLNHNVSDAAGNAAATVQRTVTVLPEPDTTAPNIFIQGANPVTLIEGDTYAEEGATATDDTDGDISANIVITGNVDTTVAGTYTLAYNVSDAAGNAASTEYRYITVLEQDTISIDEVCTSSSSVVVRLSYVIPIDRKLSILVKDISESPPARGSIYQIMLSAGSGTYEHTFDLADMVAGTVIANLDRAVVYLTPADLAQSFWSARVAQHTLQPHQWVCNNPIENPADSAEGNSVSNGQFNAGTSEEATLPPQAPQADAAEGVAASSGQFTAGTSDEVVSPPPTAPADSATGASTSSGTFTE